MTNWFFIFLFLLVISITLGFLITFFTVPFVPTSRRIVSEILSHMHLEPGDRLIDMGSGDGRLLIDAVKTFNIKRAVGYEISPLVLILAHLNLFFTLGPTEKRVIFVAEDFYKAELKRNDKVFCYLTPTALSVLDAYFKKNKGIKVFTYEFSIPNVDPIEVITLSNEKHLYVYNY